MIDAKQGTLRASTDLTKYDSADDWVEFKFINGLRLTGGGTLDGQGSSVWGGAQCPKNKNCKILPVVRVLDIYLHQASITKLLFFVITQVEKGINMMNLFDLISVDKV